MVFSSSSQTTLVDIASIAFEETIWKEECQDLFDITIVLPCQPEARKCFEAHFESRGSRAA
jgi:hypothetical protein